MTLDPEFNKHAGNIFNRFISSSSAVLPHKKPVLTVIQSLLHEMESDRDPSPLVDSLFCALQPALNGSSPSLTLEFPIDMLNRFTEQDDATAVKATSSVLSNGQKPVPSDNVEPDIDTQIALLAHSAVDDSPSLKAALSGPDAENWKAGIKKELDTLWSTGTWIAVPKSEVPNHIKPMTAKIHLKLKRDPVRQLVQYKGRYVVRGYY